MTYKKIIITYFVYTIILLCIQNIRKKRDNNFLNKFTNILIYLGEIFTASTILNLFLDKETFISQSNFLLIFKDYLFAYAIYQIIIEIILNFWDGTTLDEYNSLHIMIRKFRISAEESNLALLKMLIDYNKALKKIYESNSFSEFNLETSKNIKTIVEDYLSEKTDKSVFKRELDRLLLDIEENRNIVSFAWQHSILLRIFK